MTDHSEVLTLRRLLANFPRDIYPEIRPNQRQILEIIAEGNRRSIIEAPVGSGKTAPAVTLLRTTAELGLGQGHYIVPKKALVDQAAKMHPDLTPVYGRSEYDCFYYTDADPPAIFKADEIPCLTLHDCPHRVNMMTGETEDEEAERCKYYSAKWRAKNARMVVETFQFYLFTQLFSKEIEKPAVLVIDEAHLLAPAIRSALSYDITDYHLFRSAELLDRVGASDEAEQLERFAKRMISIVRRKPMKRTLLSPEEIAKLIGVLEEIDADRLKKRIGEEISKGKIDPLQDREVLNRLENITYNLTRYIHSLEYALETEDHNPLNYIYSYSENEPTENDKVQYKVVVKGYHVAPLIRKRLLAPITVAMSATIGDAEIFGFDSGIKGKFYNLPATFPIDNTRIFLPSDTPDLSGKALQKSRSSMTKELRRIAKECRRIKRAGHRSLVVVISNSERTKFLRVAEEEGVEVVTYGEGKNAKEAVAEFKDGQGDVLLGTAAHFAEGIDLPEEIAPFVFYLRPNYPSPEDPGTQFEQQRFRGDFWRLMRWRARLQVLQVRGRNVRSANDRGITILISQQFKDFAYGSLPEWLKPAFKKGLTLEQCVKEGLKMLKM